MIPTPESVVIEIEAVIIAATNKPEPLDVEQIVVAVLDRHGLRSPRKAAFRAAVRHLLDARFPALIEEVKANGRRHLAEADDLKKLHEICAPVWKQHPDWTVGQALAHLRSTGQIQEQS